ncbi:hypothetical protein [Mesorhizobium cantuariense]|uniref:Uncharacterized protein n=1 Tax=Mesorhizobium cantuariense TaxID=1300275 RepID=A0ABV7MQE1_9HYPH
MPKTLVPGGEAMPAIHRRAILSGIAALASGAGLHRAIAAPLAPEDRPAPPRALAHPDAELLRLGREITATDLRRHQVSDRIDEATARYNAVYDAAGGLGSCRPKEEFLLGVPASLAVLVQPGQTYDDCAASLPSEHRAARAWRQIKAATATEKKTAAEWQKACDDLADETGVTAGEAEYERLYVALHDVGMRILATPAATLDGMQVKLEAVRAMGYEMDVDENTDLLVAWRSLAGDVERLAGTLPNDQMQTQRCLA